MYRYVQLLHTVQYGGLVPVPVLGILVLYICIRLYTHDYLLLVPVPVRYLLPSLQVFVLIASMYTGTRTVQVEYILVSFWWLRIPYKYWCYRYNTRVQVPVYIHTRTYLSPTVQVYTYWYKSLLHTTRTSRLPIYICRLLVLYVCKYYCSTISIQQ